MAAASEEVNVTQGRKPEGRGLSPRFLGQRPSSLLLLSSSALPRSGYRDLALGARNVADEPRQRQTSDGLGALPFDLPSLFDRYAEMVNARDRIASENVIGTNPRRGERTEKLQHFRRGIIDTLQQHRLTGEL